jgi:two-component system sensor histidine kinase KdpD
MNAALKGSHGCHKAYPAGFSGRVVILLPDEKGSLTARSRPGNSPQKELSQHSGCSTTVSGGLGTHTLSGSLASYLPLFTSSRTVGVLGILPDLSSAILDQEQIHILESFANQAAMALERALLAEETQQAVLKAETETLRSTLLSSVSHDLRTPLAAVTGAASTLLQRDIALDQAGRQELIQTIYEESGHLNQIIRNVLDMTRLESGAITVKKEWQSLEEIVGVVLIVFDKSGVPSSASCGFAAVS